MATVYDVISGPDSNQIIRSFVGDAKRLDNNRRVVFFLKKPTDTGSKVVSAKLLSATQNKDMFKIIAKASMGFKMTSKLKISYNAKTRKGTAALMDA